MKTHIALVASLFAVLAGCSAADTTDADGASSAAAATEELNACGTAKFNEALVHYKAAVEGSKERLAHGACDSDNGLQWQIADEASRAVTTCGDFRKIIQTSPFAEPLRTALADSLTLKSLTGELLVIKDSEFQSWAGVEAMLPGTEFWSRAVGSGGSHRQIVFGERGTATFRFLVDDPARGFVPQEERATYTVERTAGERGKRTITVVHGGLTETYQLTVKAGHKEADAPIFVLTPEVESDAPNGGRQMLSLVEECDA